MNELQERYNKAIQNGEDFILTEEDIKYGTDNTGKEIRTIDDLVMVHKTSYFPNGAIKTSYETERQEPADITLKVDGVEKTFSYPFRVYRNTIHFCLNGSVESHAYGNWDNKKYAIFMPLSSNKDKIVGGTECDLFSEGSVDINETAYILCPKEEITKMKKANPTAHIIGYEGNSAGPYINVFLSQVLGYKYKEPQESSRNWGSDNNGKRYKDSQTAYDIILENGWEYGSHHGSRWHREEEMWMFTNMLCEKINIILTNNILSNEENFSSVRELIFKAISAGDTFAGYSFLGSLQNPELFAKISDQVLNVTEINISAHITNEELANSNLADKLTDIITKQLRIMAIEKKQTESPESLTEKEIIQMHYSKEIGSLEEALFGNIFTQEQLEILKKYQTLVNRELNTLSEEELKVVVEVQNIKLSFLNKKTNEKQQIFSLMTHEIITPESSEESKKVGDYLPPDNRQLILTFNTKELYKRISELSGIDIDALYDRLNNLDFLQDADEMYEINRQISDFPSLHTQLKRNTAFTDFDFSDCKTVKELSDRIMQCAQLYERLYNGEKISFDKKGNTIISNFIDGSESIKYSEEDSIKSFKQAQSEFELLTQQERKKMKEEELEIEETQQEASHIR